MMILPTIFAIILLDIIFNEGEYIMKFIKWFEKLSVLKKILLAITSSLLLIFSVNAGITSITNYNILNEFYSNYINKPSEITVSIISETNDNLCMKCKVAADFDGNYYVMNPYTNYKVKIKHGKLNNIYIYDVLGNDNTKQDIKRKNGVISFGREDSDGMWLQSNKISITDSVYNDKMNILSDKYEVEKYKQQIAKMSDIAYKNQVYISLASSVSVKGEIADDGFEPRLVIQEVQELKEQTSLITPYVIEVEALDSVREKYLIVIVTKSVDEEFTSKLYLYSTNTFSDDNMRGIINDTNFASKCSDRLNNEDLNNVCTYYSSDNYHGFSEYYIDEFVREVNLILNN